MGEFDGKSVIVTGGALGIGGAASEAFAKEGANVTNYFSWWYGTVCSR